MQKNKINSQIAPQIGVQVGMYRMFWETYPVAVLAALRERFWRERFKAETADG